MKNLRKFLAFLVFVMVATTAIAQDVRWSQSLREDGGDKYTIVLEAKLAPNISIYNITPNDYGYPTNIEFTLGEGAKLNGDIKVVTPPIVDNGVEKFKKSAIFEQNITAENGSSVKILVKYQSCNDMLKRCGMLEEKEFVCHIGNAQPATDTPVEEVAAEEHSTEWGTLWQSIIEAILWGFAALLTPCVFPMVPMTVSYFTKGSSSPARGRLNAAIYGLFIVLLYTLPIAIMVIIAQFIGGMGSGSASFIKEFATHPVPNIIFFVIFMVFAASFFGAFEITMPSKLVNKSDSQSDKGGLLGIFFMAFTLVLASFSCTGPIVSTVLIKSTSGEEIWSPIITMFAFSVAFALPFTICALFPSLLKKLPKSGGWLNSVKVVLGFIEVALGFKFLQVADQSQQWGLLNREVYLAIWIVVFSLLGLYLLGKIRFAHDSEVKHISVGRLALAIAVFSFVVYMIPGMWGAPLKALSGYLPDISTQEFVIGKYAPVESQTKMKFTDLEEAEAYAKQVGKPLFIDITGNSCANCREMEALVLSDATVQQILHDEYVEVVLCTDDKSKLSEDKWFTTKEGKVLKELGKKNTYYAESRGVSYLPCYILQDADGKELAAPRGYNTDIKAFVEFLRQGVEKFNANK